MTKTNENPKPTLDALKSSHEFTVLSTEEETELTGGGEGNETAEPISNLFINFLLLIKFNEQNVKLDSPK